MRNEKLRRLVLTALFAAMTTVATIHGSIPTGLGGNVNVGDCIILLSAWLLGPVTGAAVGGVGASLADLLSVGYAAYAPATLVIKALMGLCAGGLCRRMKNRTVGCLTGGIVAETIMVLGYFLYETLLYGLEASIPGVCYNLFQAVFGLVAAMALFPLLRRLTHTK